MKKWIYLKFKGFTMKIGLVVNTRKQNTEFEVEYDPPHTIELIKHGIEATGHEYVFIEADENVLENLKKIKPDLVFNRSEGLRGDSRESHIPAILEMLGIPYVGANVLTTAVCLNKGWTKKVLEYHEIKTAKFFICNNLEEAKKKKIEYPVILKPNEEGSSVGINEDNVVNDFNQLEKKFQQMQKDYQQGILIESFIAGREFSVGVLGKIDGTFEVLAIIEIDFSKLPDSVGGVFGQRAKTKYDDLDHYVCPARTTAELQAKIEKVTLDICNVLAIRDFARIDFRLNKKNELVFLEINPLPGMDFDMAENDFSFYPMMAERSGYSYDQLIRRLLESACHRYEMEF